MQGPLAERDIVLVGAGHTHAHVLRMWRMQPIPGARLVCVSPFAWATYSGMLPGTLAGLYAPERMQIDLRRLCASVGARLVTGAVVGIDRAAQRVYLADRPPLAYDVLSLGIGSLPVGTAALADAGSLAVTVKPMQTFLDRLAARAVELRELPADRPCRVAVVGGGAGGVEIASCLPKYLARAVGSRTWELTLWDRGVDLLPGLPEATRAAARRELTRAGWRLELGQAVVRVSAEGLVPTDGRPRPVDLVIWAPSAAAPPLLGELGLATDERGFLLTRPSLQTLDDERVFAVGDSGTLVEAPTPKAGVYAVRQGPILWQNLHRWLAGQPLVAYRPQRDFLSLLALGDRRAILSYRGRSATGGWCWRLKDRIDGRFMDKYQTYPPPATMGGARTVRATAAPQPRCAGCGGKVGSTVLARVLARLAPTSSERVRLGLATPDDAALIAVGRGGLVTATTDFFTAFVDDPYLVGRVAALHAASDLWAMGSRPLAALALATIPAGPAAKQEELLSELLAGGLVELRAMGADLVGGHTIEGAELTVGFTMLGDPPEGPPRTKAGLRPGDALLLTKPLGTGVLLAAQMQARCRAEWFAALEASLLRSNGPWVERLSALDVTGLTDVTGFGLAGHLGEMLSASRVSAEVELARLPLLPGAAELLAAGWHSTLAPANRDWERLIEAPPSARERPAYRAIFDPQTSGGLLVGVPAPQVADLLAAVAAAGEEPPALIGRVTERSADPRLIVRGDARG